MSNFFRIFLLGNAKFQQSKIQLVFFPFDGNYDFTFSELIIVSVNLRNPHFHMGLKKKITSIFLTSFFIV